MSKYAIQVKNVKKVFYLPHHKNNSLKAAITQAFKPKDKSGKIFNALDGVSFNVEKGDFFGILGRNGSGKSTLLKIISEIYQPTSGTVKHYGKLVSFIELGVGFKSELSGRENVFLNGALLGFSKSEIEEMYDEIVQFAELEDFMDQKLKNYSSGMKVRLAFSVAIRAKSDILILDEVLAVGDAAFQKKCTDYFETLKDTGKTVILVTHSMGNVRRFCNRAIVIDEGKVTFSGKADEAADAYLALFENAKAAQKQSTVKSKTIQDSDVRIDNVVVKQDNQKTSTVRFGEDFSLSLNITSKNDYDDVVAGVHIVNQSGKVVSAITTKTFQDNLKLYKGLNTYDLDIQNIFSEGKYTLNIAIKQKNANRFLVQASDVCQFSVTGIDTTRYNPSSLVYPDVKLRVSNSLSNNKSKGTN